MNGDAGSFSAALAETAAAPILVGLSAAGFAAVISAAGGRSTLAGMTTGALKQSHVLPTTKASAAAYSDALRARPDGAALVGPATQFLSHAYDYLFLDAVDAAIAWEAQHARDGGGPHFFYFDLLVVNQHSQHAVVPFEVLRDEFGGGVRGVGSTLFMLDFESPISLSRAWCVFEAATSLACGASFEVVMAPRAEAAFNATLLDNFESLLAKVCAVDVERATAREPADEANIKRAIVDDMGGFLAVNKIVIGSMREWMAAAGRAALHALPEGARIASTLQHNLSNLLYDQGKYVEAESLLREALSERREAGGSMHPSSLVSLSALALVLSKQGRLVEAESLSREALAGAREAMGFLHRVTMGAALNLANLLYGMNKLTEAEALYRETLAGERRILGPDHPSTLDALSSLASVLKTRGQLAEAESMFREALAGKRRALGSAHPSTLVTMCNLANLLCASAVPLFGERPVIKAEAEVLLREALAGEQKTLGDAHPSTLTTLRDLGTWLFTLGRLDEAEPLLISALAGLRGALGSTHATTLSCLGNVAIVLSRRGKLAEATRAFTEALEGERASLGDAHPAVARTKGAFAMMLKGAEKYREAEPLLRELLLSNRAVLGPAHPTTSYILFELIDALAHLERHADIALLLRAELAEKAARTDTEMGTLLLLLSRSLPPDDKEVAPTTERAAHLLAPLLLHPHALEPQGADFATGRLCDICRAARMPACASCIRCGFDVCQQCAVLVRSSDTPLATPKV